MKCVLVILILLLAELLTTTSQSTHQYINRMPQHERVVPISEITLERVWERCENCGDYRVVLQRDTNNPYGDAAVTYTLIKSKSQKRGKLYAYFYNQLIKLIESNRYYEMKDSYGEGIQDTLITKSSVVRSGTRKMIINRGEEPIELWGIEAAIDGIIERIKWEGMR